MNKKGLGIFPVFFMAAAIILGVILFLRFGVAVGMLGFWGAILIVVLGLLITIPTALIISEISKNTRVGGGGEHFIISRFFGLKIGSTFGIVFYFLQAISVAFYIIAFTEAFAPLFDWAYSSLGFLLPRQVISVPALLLLACVKLKQASGLKIAGLLLTVSLLCFFAGAPIDPGEDPTLIPGDSLEFFNSDHFFILFAICFPVFAGITAVMGLIGDLRNPDKAIPLGIMGGILTGFIVCMLAIWKLSVSASQVNLVNDQLIMSKIAIWGFIGIPIGLAVVTVSLAICSIFIAPRTLQALASDKSLPIKNINSFLSKGKGESREPLNASIVTVLIALVFVLMGNVNAVAQILSMLILITCGNLCLISFLNHFGAFSSYCPRFKSKWLLSLGGFLLSGWVMFMINPFFTFLLYGIIAIIFLTVKNTSQKDRLFKRMKRELKCPKCNTEFLAGTKFCPNCGYNLETDFKETPTCPMCEKIFPTGTKFCTEDGTKLELVLPEQMIPCCEICGKTYNDLTKFCPEDGGKVLSEAFRKEETDNRDFENEPIQRNRINNKDDEFIENPVCPKCHKVFVTGIKHCDADGSRLVSSDKMIPKCVKCGKDYPAETKFCIDDGGQVIPEALRKRKRSKNDFKEKVLDLLGNWLERNDKKSESEGESKNKFKKSTFFSIGLLFSFFLPWVNVLFWQLSAFEIPMKLDTIDYFGELFGKNMAYVKVTYLVYLIPCCSIYHIIVDLLGKEKSVFFNEFSIGLTVTTLLFISILIFNGSFAVFSVGYYLTAMFSILGLLFNDRKESDFE